MALQQYLASGVGIKMVRKLRDLQSWARAYVHAPQRNLPTLCSPAPIFKKHKASSCPLPLKHLFYD